MKRLTVACAVMALLFSFAGFATASDPPPLPGQVALALPPACAACPLSSPGAPYLSPNFAPPMQMQAAATRRTPVRTLFRSLFARGCQCR